MTLYNPNLDLVNDNEYTKFGHILSIPSHDIEQKPNSDMNLGCDSVANLREKQLFTIPT